MTVKAGVRPLGANFNGDAGPNFQCDPEVYHFDVEPLEDRLVLFSSEWLEHEARERMSCCTATLQIILTTFKHSVRFSRHMLSDWPLGQHESGGANCYNHFLLGLNQPI